MDNNNVHSVMDVLKEEVKNYDVPVVDLIKIQTDDPFKILIATILSARTKDGTTAKAAARLFEKATSFQELDNLSLEEIQELIYPVGFYKTKASNIKKIPLVIQNEFNGKIPKDVDDLVKLPGVGRKTANLVSSVAFGEDAICVDTHVHKIMNRLGYLKTRNPFETEMALREKLPRKYWRIVNNLFVAFGQNICVPVSPHCSKCPINKYCSKVGVKNSR